ncbi:MAG TPA: hypothetical protein VJ730_02700 [Nitrososphaera sp.]|jgi:hypothetical protein|nr:hypothetical protein [Nitrososphaera sp.]
MIISLRETLPCDKDIKFQPWLCGDMADGMMMFAVTTGIFVFLVAVVFGARAKRYSSGYTKAEGHAESHG